jgi:hypothetical protein
MMEEGQFHLDRAVGRIEGKLDAIILQQQENATRLTKIEDRVDKWENRAVGAIAVLGVIGAGLMWLLNQAVGFLRT